MTRLGKVLVLLNLGLSVVLATWAFSIYSNSIDWTNRKTPRMGQFAIRDAKLTELWKGVDPVETDWLRERAQLAKEEQLLAAERVWYDKEIRYVLVGPAKGQGILEVALAAQDDPGTGVKKGQVRLKDGYPQLVPILDPNNAPLSLKSLREYNIEDEGILREIASLIEQHQKQIEEANALTDRIIGDPAKGKRGLQQRINDEQAKNAEVIAELKLVEPHFINTLVEARQVNKRHEQMKRRIDELKKVNVASK